MSVIDLSVILIQPLVELVRHGDIYTKTHCLRALTALAALGEADKIVHDDMDSIPLVLDLLFDSRSNELIATVLDFCVTCYKAIQDKPKRNPFTRKSYGIPEHLVSMLAPRLRTNERYPPNVLGGVAALILLISGDKSSAGRAYKPVVAMLEADVIGKLMAVIKRYNQYALILPKITSALGTVFYAAQELPIMYGRGASKANVNEQADEHAVALVQALSKCIDSKMLQVCLNVLIALRYIVRLDKAVELGFTKREPERRFNILKLICSDDHGFEQILQNVQRDAELMETRASRALRRGFRNVVSKRGNSKEAIEAEKQLWESNKRVAESAQKNVAWFQKRIDQAKRCEWEFEAFYRRL
eukprot:TRINITY_DN97034_c0_g1_i1.p1 TRINITY_DN97034_c0_g1~~TRINITY_DN97034_c0_g1_i1.p1  ORF type:complete len:400 (+),score=257.06 TRINITY_DN97034_c0_g1_i1:129-1202(+)